jgi:hypothetical protein
VNVQKEDKKGLGVKGNPQGRSEQQFGSAPERVFVGIGPDGKVIRFRWHSSASKWLVLFVICSPIALAIGWNDLLTSRYAQGILAILAFCFLYIALAGWLNASTITLTRNQLSVRHGPFPWPANRRLPAKSIRGLKVVEHYVQTENGKRLTYRLIATNLLGDIIRLISAFDKSDHDAAEYIRQTLGEWLGLNDSVSG